MGTKKPSTNRAARRSTKTPAPKTTAPKKHSPEAPASEKREQIAFDEARNSLPETTAVQRGALLRLYTKAACASLGATTRAEDVIPEARRALLSAVETVLAHGSLLRYPPVYLRFAMDQLDLLEAQFARQQAGAARSASTSSRTARAEENAKSARGELVKGLEPVVRADDDERTLFEKARGNLSGGTDLHTSLTALIEVAERWRTHEDEELRALAEMQGITAEQIDAAREAASALKEARDTAHKSTDTAGRDLPLTNELEGRVIYEVGKLYSAIDDNRASTEVPLPKVGPTILRALEWGKKDGKKGDAKKSELAKKPEPDVKVKEPAKKTPEADEEGAPTG